jgi:hypothetical protein
MQAQTRDASGVTHGHWFLAGDLEGGAPERELILLELRKERSLMLPYGGGAAAEAMVQRIYTVTDGRVNVPDAWEGPVCYSRDRKLPVLQLDTNGSKAIETVSETCEACEMARWRSIRGRRMQECGESYRIDMLDVSTQMPVTYYARGAAIKPVRNLLTGLKAASYQHRRPAYGFTFVASAKEIEREDGTYYEPAFSRPRLIEDPDTIASACATRLGVMAASAHATGE